MSLLAAELKWAWVAEYMMSQISHAEKHMMVNYVNRLLLVLHSIQMSTRLQNNDINAVVDQIIPKFFDSAILAAPMA